MLTNQAEISEQIIELSPENIDVIYSKQGETLRFMGLPFARVRTMLGIEKTWFGVGRERRILTDENWKELVELVDLLLLNRASLSPNKRHEYYRTAPEAWLESLLRRNIKLLDANLILSPIYNQFRSSNDKIDLLALRRDGRLVIIELKTQPDREMIFQAADYWRKIELQRRRGLLTAADLFDGREIADKPAIIYLAAPAWSFHRDFEFFARAISPEIEMWRFELHENWREKGSRDRKTQLCGSPRVSKGLTLKLDVKPLLTRGLLQIYPTNRYPTPRTVWTIFGLLGSSSKYLRRRTMKLSIARVSVSS